MNRTKRIGLGLERLERVYAECHDSAYAPEIMDAICRILRKYRSIKRPAGNEYLDYLYQKPSKED